MEGVGPLIYFRLRKGTHIEHTALLNRMFALATGLGGTQTGNNRRLEGKQKNERREKVPD